MDTAAAAAESVGETSSVDKTQPQLTIETTSKSAPEEETTNSSNVNKDDVVTNTTSDLDNSFAAELEKMSQDADAILESIIHETQKPTTTRKFKSNHSKTKKRRSPKATTTTTNTAAAVITPKSSNKSSTVKSQSQEQEFLLPSFSSSTPSLSVPTLHKNDPQEDDDDNTIHTDVDDRSLITDHDMTDDDRSILTMDEDDDDRSIQGSSSYRAKVRQLSKELQTAEQEFLRQQQQQQQTVNLDSKASASTPSPTKPCSATSTTLSQQNRHDPAGMILQSVLALATICTWGVILFILWSLWHGGVTLLDARGVISVAGFFHR